MTTAIAEIDENLVRHNLDAAEQALAIAKRGELVGELDRAEAEKAKAKGFAAQNCAPKPRTHRSSGKAKGEAQRKPASARDLAAKLGVAESTIRNRFGPGA